MKKEVLSQRELETERILKATLPEFTVRANMRLADVIHAGKQFRYMSGYHLDFVICDSLNHTVAAVELDDSTHDTQDGQRKDANKNKWLADASIKLIRIRKPEEAHRIRELIQNYTPPAVQKITPSATPKRKKNAPSKVQGVIFGLIGIIAMVIFIPKILKNMGDNLVKHTEETQKQLIKTAQKTAPPPITEKPKTPSNEWDWVFVKGKTLKECAPDNYINETVLRCTRDHYDPPQHGNH